MSKTAAELAALIRDQVDFDHHSKMSEDERHLFMLAAAVTAELNMDVDAANVNYIARLITPHCTPPSREYPKALAPRKIGERQDGSAIYIDHIVNSKEEEDAAI